MLRKFFFFLYQPLLLLRDWLLAPDQGQGFSTEQFIKGINLGGEAVTIEGHFWDSYRNALANGLSTPGAQTLKTYVLPQPGVGREMCKMLNTAVFKPHILEIEQALPNGGYNIYLWMMENYQTDWHSLKIIVQGCLLDQDVGRMHLGRWSKYGPYPGTVTNDILSLKIASNNPKLDAFVMGVGIFLSGDGK